MNGDIKQLLQDLKDGHISVDEAMLELKKEPFKDIDFAKVDMHRKIRQGASEVIYGEGKTAEQILNISQTMLDNEQKCILITRLSAEKAEAIAKKLDIKYNEIARCGVIGEIPEPDGIGNIVIACAGTSDLYVAEEAAITAEVHGNKVIRLYDVGVSGLHRLFAHIDELMNASVVVAIAGMEGALASVLGGLVDCPLIAVPTSVGYGANFGGLSALLSMLNSCASGSAVVNIDNGFGAGFMASRINHMEVKK